jgi:photosystem II stability/assembly factor-like uncharacterized protein
MPAPKRKPASRRKRAASRPGTKSAPRAARSRQVCLCLGTRKGAFLLRSDWKRRQWRIEGPYFAGREVNHVVRDGRTGRVWAAVNSAWHGSSLQVSEDGGQRWTKCAHGPGFAPGRGLTLNRLWRVQPDRASRPGTLWCGADPGALFRTDDGGATWREVAGLTQHATRERWDAGGGGMMVHSILLDPDGKSMSAAISVAGFFHSEDDGATWQPRNRGVLADFQSEPYPEVGQCVHAMAASPRHAEWIFQQGHCGVFRTRDGGRKWEDVSAGLPSRFGFALAAHPREEQTLYVVPETSSHHRYFADARLSVWRSEDGGDSWRALTRGLPARHAYQEVLRHALAADACDPAGLYLGTTGGQLYCSLDRGASWRLVHAHFPAILSVEAAEI